mgnify:CR=1 FL=1
MIYFNLANARFFYIEREVQSLIFFNCMITLLLGKLQGLVKFRTGGIPREPKGRNRLNSGGDSKVWMKEDFFIILFYIAY